MATSHERGHKGSTPPPVGPNVVIEGRAIPILHSYPTSPRLQLHSLAELADYECSTCRRRQQSAMVALDGTSVVCPGCYAWLAIPEPRRPR